MKQGALGDCWLISAFAAIAEYPRFVRSLIKEHGDNTYTVPLHSYESGRRVAEEVDDAFPIQGGRLAYAHFSEEDEIWPCVLEKAFAKSAGGYLELNSGKSCWAFGALTGCTDFEYIKVVNDASVVTKYTELPDSDKPHDWHPKLKVLGDPMANDSLTDLLYSYDSKKYLMCASSRTGSDTNKTAENISQGHAYTVLQIAKNPAGSEYNVIKLRNPWGCTEWNGDWSDGDAMWDNEPDVAQALNYEEAEDGSFWMPIDDFVDQFGGVHVCKKSMKGYTGACACM
jgi:hypothetical protein